MSDMNSMHSKQKGDIGVAAVTLDLVKQGIPVFHEYGDLSRTDMIALYNGVPIKIQVKAYKSDKNNQKKKIRFAKDYTSFAEAVSCDEGQ